MSPRLWRDADADRRGIDNTPPPDLETVLRGLEYCVDVLERARVRWTSAYRRRELTEALFGSMAASAPDGHHTGCCVDVVPRPGQTLLALRECVLSMRSLPLVRVVVENDHLHLVMDSDTLKRWGQS